MIFGRKDPYMALFNDCSNCSSPLHIYSRSHRLKIDFHDENYKKSSCLKPQGLES